MRDLFDVEASINFSKKILASSVHEAYTGADHSVDAWNEYCRLKKLWDNLYPNEKWEDYK